jgi:hypothetical protein
MASPAQVQGVVRRIALVELGKRWKASTSHRIQEDATLQYTIPGHPVLIILPRLALKRVTSESDSKVTLFNARQVPTAPQPRHNHKFRHCQDNKLLGPGPKRWSTVRFVGLLWYRAEAEARVASVALGGLCSDVPPAMPLPASKSCLTADVTDQHCFDTFIHSGLALLTCRANFTETFTQCSKSRFEFLRRPFCGDHSKFCGAPWALGQRGLGHLEAHWQQQLYTVTVTPGYTVPLSFPVLQSARTIMAGSSTGEASPTESCSN